MRQLKISKSITNRESESLEKYLHEIGKIDLLTPEEEVELALLIKKGNQEALNKLTRANLRFVVSVAKQYQNQGLTLPDLINEGNLGLIKAAQRFDETRGFKFISYAVWWIRQSIMQSLAEQSRIVRLPLNKVGLSNKVSKAYMHLEQEFERNPTPEEIAIYLGVTPVEVYDSINMSNRHMSMDEPVSNAEGAGTLLELMICEDDKTTDNDLVVTESLNTDINRSLRVLTHRQKEVIMYFFGIGIDHPLSLEDIGDRLSLTRERVRQIKDKAICKMRATEKTNLLRGYLGISLQ